MKNIENKIQSNTYLVFDSMGRKTEVYVIASNIKEAYQKARGMISEIGSSYYKVKRCYNGGVRG